MSDPRRITITGAGGLDKLFIETFTPDAPGPDQVRIAVHSIGLNFADIFCRLGLYAAAPAFPFTPGFEVSGTIESVGTAVEEFKPGDEVFAVTRFRGYTTLLTIGADRIRPVPDGWTLSEAAAFPVVALTAWYGLHHLGRISKAETVVITSAAGGVGTMACRLARAAGARVIAAVGSTKKRQVAYASGAHEVVVSGDYRIWDEVAHLTDGTGVDLVFDAVGGRGLKQAYRHLRPDGRLICYGFADLTPPGGRRPWLRLALRYYRTPRFSPFSLVQDNRSVLGFNLVYLWDRPQLFGDAIDQVLAIAQKHEFRPLIGASFPFEEVGKAHQFLQSRQSIGKVLLVPASD